MKYTLKQTDFGYYSVENMPTNEELMQFYEEKYYQNNKAEYSHTYTEDEYQFFKNEAILTEYILEKNNTDKGNLLDIGAGEGFFAKYFFDNKWSVTTLDYSNYGIKTHNPDLSQTLIQGDIFKSIDSLIAQKNSFNLINLSNILEHVIEPVKLLENLKALLSKDAMLRISVPNDYSDFQEFLLKKEYTTNTWFCPPEHLHYFTLQSLSNLLQSLNYEVAISFGEFPIELFLSNQSSNYVKDRAHGKFAHKSRVEVDNFLFEQGIEKYLNYHKASAEIGLSRQIILFARKK